MKIILTTLVFCMALYCCTKSGDTSDNEVPEKIKPEWRIKRILTEAHNIRVLTVWKDTMTFEYDTLGRFSKIRYRLFGRADNPDPIQDYTTYLGDDLRFEYFGNEERVRKYYINLYNGKLLRSGTFYYDNAGDKLLRLLLTNEQDNTYSEYIFKYRSGNNPVEYWCSIDSQITTLTYSGNSLIKKVNSRLGGANINTFTFTPNAAGNTVSSLVVGQYPPHARRHYA